MAVLLSSFGSISILALFLFYLVAKIHLHRRRKFFACGMWKLEESFEGGA